jgi:hypothetical protein
MKKGLVIQGPLFSPGFGPYEFSKSGSFEKSWIEFDCKENILLTIQDALKYFDFIVLTTWKNTDYQEFIDSLSRIQKVHVVAIHESEGLKKLGMQGIHKYHQIATLQAGLQKLVELGCDLSAKVRTDHKIDIAELAQEVDDHQFKNVFSLGVPNLNLYELDRLTDFYFVGRSQVMYDLCTNYLVQKEYCLDTHKDYFLSFLNFLSKNETLVSRINQRDSSFRSDVLAISVWTTFFYPLSPKLFKNFYWRGKKVNHRLNSWIRWFHVFHSSAGRSSGLKFFMNLSFIFIVRLIKRRTIKLFSFFTYRFYRFKAQRL